MADVQSSSKLRRVAARSAVGVLVGATVLALAPAAFAVEPARPQLQTVAGEDSAGLQRALGALVDNGDTAALAEVRDGGGVSWRGAAGVAEVNTGQPVLPGGRFRIGSITKTFVATVVLQLVAEHRLSLDDPIERHLPGLVPGGSGMTVRQVLNHTSGIYNYTEDPSLGLGSPSWVTTGRWKTYTPEEIVAIATAHAPYFPPGQGWHYSNTDYIVAGMLIEKLTGHTWSEEVERRIIRPLDLHGTSMPTTRTGIPGPHAHGYLKLPSGRVDVTELNPSVAGSAGAGISTADDLARFNAALLGGRLLGPAELAAMKTTVPAGPNLSYGLGLARFSTPCGDFWGHDGGIPGYETLILGDAGGHRQVALSETPYDPTAGAGQAKTDFLLKAVCRMDPPQSVPARTTIAAMP